MGTVAISGTLTDLSSVVNAARSNLIGNEPRLEGAKGAAPGGSGLNFEALKGRDGLQFDELRQFIQLVATNLGLHYWAAASLVQMLLNAHMESHRTGTLLGDGATANRTFSQSGA